MSNLSNKLLIAFFILFISGGFALHMMMPDKTFSSVENRSLEQMPKLTLENAADGSFMEDFETYTTDQFPARDFWVATKAWCERLSGKRENNGVYFSEQDTLINRLDEPSAENLDQAAQYLNALGASAGVPVYFGLIPSSAEIWRDRLPAGAPSADEGELIETMYNKVQVGTIDILSALDAHQQEEIYYRTDHHWTSLGAYYGYQALIQALGETPVALDVSNKKTVSDSFFGTTYSTSGVRWVEPDRIDTYISPEGISVTSWFTGEAVEGRMYAPEYLEKKDQYSYFLGGVQPICVLKNHEVEENRVLVIRDSYSDSLAPFLTQNFSEVHLLDLRYYNAGVSRYLTEHEIDCVVVLYSVSNFASERNLFKLGM